MSTISQDNLEGQRALVTGATSGIGRAVALQLARDGAEVLVHGRDAARGAETVKEITAAGGKASFVAADLGDAADVQRLASEVGNVDILINNAGIALFSADRRVRRLRIRQDVRQQRPGAVLPRSRNRSRNGCEGPRQHRQPQQHDHGAGRATRAASTTKSTWMTGTTPSLDGWVSPAQKQRMSTSAQVTKRSTPSHSAPSAFATSFTPGARSGINSIPMT